MGQVTADVMAAHVEAGYQLGRLTPFASLRARSVSTPDYSETTLSGSSTYALGYEAHTDTFVRSELGVEMQVVDRADLAVAVRGSWAHEFSSNESGTSFFQAVPDVAFPVSGATEDRDSLILTTSAEYGKAEGVYLSARVDAEYSRNVEEYGGSLEVGYRW